MPGGILIKLSWDSYNRKLRQVIGNKPKSVAFYSRSKQRTLFSYLVMNQPKGARPLILIRLLELDNLPKPADVKRGNFLNKKLWDVVLGVNRKFEEKDIQQEVIKVNGLFKLFRAVKLIKPSVKE